MVNPEKNLKDYLMKLINRYASIKLYKKQLDIINEWERPTRIETLKKGGTFFKLVKKSFTKTFLIELCLLVSPKEKFNIHKWLEKIKIHSVSLNPTRANKGVESNTVRVKIKNEEYLKIIDTHISELISHKKTIDNLTSLREKIFAHYDPKYFSNPEKLYHKYSISEEELNKLIKTIEDILLSHHSFLFASSFISLDIASSSNINIVLQYTRAFMRVRSDKTLIAKGIRPGDYLKE